VKLSVDAPRILDFDIENRPLSYLGQDFTTSDITAIACSFHDDGYVYCWLLGEMVNGEAFPQQQILWRFHELYRQADIVTGHYIRAHDLPIINGALLEHGMPQLEPKLTVDTKLDLTTAKGVSKSQESLAAMLGIEAPKITMTQADWRSANRLERAGLDKTFRRVTGDVIQHKQMYAELVRRGLLGPPKLWTPQS
jgi:hypothetical protein